MRILIQLVCFIAAGRVLAADANLEGGTSLEDRLRIARLNCLSLKLANLNFRTNLVATTDAAKLQFKDEFLQFLSKATEHHAFLIKGFLTNKLELRKTYLGSVHASDRKTHSGVEFDFWITTGKLEQINETDTLNLKRLLKVLYWEDGRIRSLSDSDENVLNFYRSGAVLSLGRRIEKGRHYAVS